MLHFNSEKPIYMQIVDFVIEQIIQQLWDVDEKILSVRDLGAQLEVNPNTVMRAYDILQQQQMIYNKRGLGFFVHPQAMEQIRLMRKKQFLEKELPEFFKSMELLGISIDDIKVYYQNYNNNKS